MLLLNKDLMPQHEDQDGPDFSAVVGMALAMFIEHIENVRLVDQMIYLGLKNKLLGPFVEFIFSQ